MKRETKENAVGVGTSAAATTGGLLGLKAVIAGLGTTGLSAAGISTGLTAIGGTMLGGIAVASGGVAIVALGGYVGGKVIYRKYTEKNEKNT